MHFKIDHGTSLNISDETEYLHVWSDKNLHGDS